MALDVEVRVGDQPGLEARVVLDKFVNVIGGTHNLKGTKMSYSRHKIRTKLTFVQSRHAATASLMLKTSGSTMTSEEMQSSHMLPLHTGQMTYGESMKCRLKRRIAKHGTFLVLRPLRLFRHKSHLFAYFFTVPTKLEVSSRQINHQRSRASASNLIVD